MRHMAILLVACFLFACNTTNSDVEPVLQPDALAARGKPQWINRFPSDPTSYIGIGSSKSGDKSADMERARALALANLAASISVQIQSEQTFIAREDTKGESFQSAEETIRETVDQNLREVEVVDSYYSDSEGAWFYLRLKKDRWAAIQQEEMQRILRRVVSLVEPEVLDERTTVSSRLGYLWKGWSLLVSSPYEGLLVGRIGGEEGLLADVIERLMLHHIESLSLRFRPATIETRPGGTAGIQAEVRTSLTVSPGIMTIAFVRAGGIAETIATVVTNEQGVYEGEIAFEALNPGVTRLVGRIDFSSIGFDLDRIPKQFFLPEQDLVVNVRPVNIRLSVSAPPDFGATNLYGAFESLFSSNLSLKITKEGDADYQIDVTVDCQTAPLNEYGIIIVISKAFITVSAAGGSLVSFESPEFKDGGLTTSQAQTRSFGKLMDALRNMPELTTQLERAFALR